MLPLRLQLGAFHPQELPIPSTDVKLTYNDLSAMLPDSQEGISLAFSDVSSVPIQQSLRHLDRAYKNFFEGRAQVSHLQEKAGEPVGNLCLQRFHLGEWSAHPRQDG